MSLWKVGNDPRLPGTIQKAFKSQQPYDLWPSILLRKVAGLCYNHKGSTKEIKKCPYRQVRGLYLLSGLSLVCREICLHTFIQGRGGQTKRSWWELDILQEVWKTECQLKGERGKISQLMPLRESHKGRWWGGFPNRSLSCDCLWEPRFVCSDSQSKSKCSYHIRTQKQVLPWTIHHSFIYSFLDTIICCTLAAWR